MQVRW